jgi:polyisoprenoid-binding protein YceI
MSEATASPGVRQVDGRTVPEAGKWSIDKAHTSVNFVARHLMSRVRGRFSEIDGTIQIGEDPARSSVEVQVDIASVDTNQPQRDEHLRSGDFFLVDKHPKMVYRSTGLRPGPDDRFLLDGELTVRDVTRPLTLEVEFLGTGVDPYGRLSAGFSGGAEINREDWGVNWNMMLETGGFLIGKMVKIEIEARLIKEQ